MTNSERVAVVGVGLHPFGRLPDKGVEALGREAALAALQDAGPQYKDVEAGFLGRVTPTGAGVGQRIFGELGLTGQLTVTLTCRTVRR